MFEFEFTNEEKNKNREIALTSLEVCLNDTQTPFIF